MIYYTVVTNNDHADYSDRREDFSRAVVTRDGKDGAPYCMIFWKRLR